MFKGYRERDVCLGWYVGMRGHVGGVMQGLDLCMWLCIVPVCVCNVSVL